LDIFIFSQFQVEEKTFKKQHKFAMKMALLPLCGHFGCSKKSLPEGQLGRADERDPRDDDTVEENIRGGRVILW